MLLQKNTLIDWTAPWKFLIFIIQFSQGEAGQVSGALFMVEFGQILPFKSTHHGFFFADFWWDMLGHWINIDNLCYHIVVLKKKNLAKLLKIALLGPYLGKNWASMGHTQNEAIYIYWKWQKEIISFQELFISSRYKFWLSYEWFSDLYNILLPKSAIFGWKRCDWIF